MAYRYMINIHRTHNFTLILFLYIFPKIIDRDINYTFFFFSRHTLNIPLLPLNLLSKYIPPHLHERRKTRKKVHNSATILCTNQQELVDTKSFHRESGTRYALANLPVFR